MFENRENEIELNELEDVNGGYIVKMSECNYDLVDSQGNILKKTNINTHRKWYNRLFGCSNDDLARERLIKDARAAHVSTEEISPKLLQQIRSASEAAKE